jgi:hypothetical protein
MMPVALSVLLHMWKFAGNENLLSLSKTLNLQNFLWKTLNEVTAYCKDMILVEAACDADHWQTGYPLHLQNWDFFNS